MFTPAARFLGPVCLGVVRALYKARLQHKGMQTALLVFKGGERRGPVISLKCRPCPVQPEPVAVMLELSIHFLESGIQSTFTWTIPRLQYRELKLLNGIHLYGCRHT